MNAKKFLFVAFLLGGGGGGGGQCPGYAMHSAQYVYWVNRP